MQRNLSQGFHYPDAADRPRPAAAVYTVKEHGDKPALKHVLPDFWVLDYAISGISDFRVDELDWRARPAGTAHLYPPGKQYFERYAPGFFSSCYFLFKGENSFLRNLVNNEAGFVQIADPGRRIERLIREAAASASGGNAGYWKVCESFDRTMQLLETLSRPDDPVWHYTLGSPGRDPLAVRIRKHLEQHYREPLTLELLSGIFHCSQSTLEHQFRQTWQESIFSCLLRIRAEQSIPLLMNGATLKEAAAEAGFCNEFYYSRVFRKVYGVSPRNYLRTRM